MPKDSQPKELSSNQKRLVALMTSVVQEYYGSTKPSKEDVELAVTTNIERFQEIMGTVSAEITIQQNKKMDEAIAASDESPHPSY